MGMPVRVPAVAMSTPGRDESVRTSGLPRPSSPIETDFRSQGDSTDLIRHAMTILSSQERELIQMKVYAQMTFTQIAAVLDLPIGTCTSRYRRSLEKMRAILQEQVG